MFSEEELAELAEDILKGIDYDIFKEDLEERTLLDEIEFKISNFIKDVIKGIE